MGERESFLRAILARPNDDLPRLVYADWLDENGQGERAEFIRVQCELGRPTLGLDGTGDSQARYHLVRREARLWDNWRSWFGHLPGSVLTSSANACPLQIVATDTGATYTASRGFIKTVGGPLAAFWGGECVGCGGTGYACEICHGSGQVDHPSGGVNHCPNSYDDNGHHLGSCHERCDQCAGTGRVPGPTAAFAELLDREPVERVEVTDKAPSETPSGWAWWRNVGLDDTDTLPPDLYDCLSDHISGTDDERACYRTRGDAFEALYTAILTGIRCAK